MDAQLRELCEGALGLGDAPSNVSIVVGEAKGRTRSKHHLYVQGQPMIVGATDGSLVRAVLRCIAGLATDMVVGGLALRAVLVISPEGDAIVVDRRLGPGLERLEPRLRRSGHQIISPPWLVALPESGVVVLPDVTPSVGVSVAEVDDRWPRSGTDDALSSEPRRIARIVYAGQPEAASSAAEVAQMVPLVWDGDGRVRTADVAELVVLGRAAHTTGAVVGDLASLRGALGLV